MPLETPDADAPSVPETPASPVAPDASQQPPVDNTADEIRSLAESTGHDFSKFKDVESARAAHDLLIAQFASAGRALPENTPAPQPARRQSRAVVEDDLEDVEAAEIEEDEVEEEDVPVLPAKSRRPTKRETALEQRLAKLEKRDRDREARARQAEEQQLNQQVVNKFFGFIDSYDSPQLGSNKQPRSVAQEFAVNNLYDLALQIARGARQYGRTLTIEQAAAAAARQLGFQSTPKKPADGERAAPPEQVSGGGGRLPAAVTPRAVPTPTRLGALVSYMNDPEFQAAAAKIGNG